MPEWLAAWSLIRRLQGNIRPANVFINPLFTLE
jgi:hypothetical protein